MYCFQHAAMNASAEQGMDAIRQVLRRQSLEPDEVHLWWASLATLKSGYTALVRTLSKDEHERAARYLRALDRERFVASRGMLRMVLSSYLDRRPNEIHFHYSDHGKPSLKSESDQPAIEFSLTHSHELVL